MWKYFCCGISKKTEFNGENEEFQLLLLGKYLRLKFFQYVQIGPDQSAKFNILQHIASLHNQFTPQLILLSFLSEDNLDILDNVFIEFH